MNTPRKPRTRIVNPVPDADAAIDAESGIEWRHELTAGAPALPPEPVDETPVDRIAVMLQDVRGDDRAKVKLLRIKPDARAEWCADYTPAEFESGGFEMIRRDWGPGKYRVMLYGQGPSGMTVIRARDDITISDFAPTAKKPTNADSDAIAQLGQLIVQSNERIATLIAQSQAPREQPSMVEQMTQMAVMMKTLREAFGGDTPAPRQSDPLTMIETMRSMREFAVELQTGKPAEAERDGNSDMMDLAKQVMGLISAHVSTRQESVPMIAPPVSLTDAPVQVPAPMATPLPETPSDPEADMLKILLRSYMDTLIKQAEANAPIPATAQLVADKLPDMLVPMLDLPDWFDKLAALDPRVVPHRAYITQVRDAALPLLFESGDDAAA